MSWAAEAPPAVGGPWVQTLITVIGLLGGAGGVAALAATILQRRKIAADAADVITDTALTLVEPLRTRVAELENEAAGARREATAAREQAEQANVEISDLRAVVRELTGLLTRWRQAVLETAGTRDPEGALARLRVMVSSGQTNNTRQD